MPPLDRHPEATIVRLQLRQNLVLKHLDAAQWRELEPLLEVMDYPKGERLEHQGDRSMEQYFIIMKLMNEVMAHTITLHLLDAPGRIQRFSRKHAALAGRLSKKELASYLNLSPETRSRLKRHGKI
ncbi:MAG TPA: hypothetical protein VI545_05530 [Burkholderiales bacterium]|nr:hypothetical protein [Burkholderiales bacterium]